MEGKVGRRKKVEVVLFFTSTAGNHTCEHVNNIWLTWPEPLLFTPSSFIIHNWLLNFNSFFFLRKKKKIISKENYNRRFYTHANESSYTLRSCWRAYYFYFEEYSPLISILHRHEHAHRFPDKVVNCYCKIKVFSLANTSVNFARACVSTCVSCVCYQQTENKREAVFFLLLNSCFYARCGVNPFSCLK